MQPGISFWCTFFAFTPAFLLMIPSNVFEFLFNHTHSVHTGGRGGLNLLPNFQNRGACAGKEGSEILNDQKLYKQKCFSVITNNFNWEVFGCNTYTEKGIRFQRDSSEGAILVTLTNAKYWCGPISNKSHFMRVKKKYTKKRCHYHM